MKFSELNDSLEAKVEHEEIEKKELWGKWIFNIIGARELASRVDDI